MTNICAAIGLGQLKRVEEIVKRKREIANLYSALLEGVVEVHQQKNGYLPSYWMVTILVSSEEERDPLREHLSAAGIETRPAFYPVHTMPMYSERFAKHPRAESIGWRGINLPSYPRLSDEDVSDICKEINDFYIK